MDGEVFEVDDVDEERTERAASAPYQGPDGGEYYFSVIEYSSPSAANESVSEASAQQGSVAGYVLIDQYVYVAVGPDRSGVREFARQSPSLSGNCVSSELSFIGGGNGTATPDETTPDQQEPEDDPGNEVRIGMIQPLSGSLQAYGTIALRGFYTYFGYRGADIPGEITEGTEEFDVDGTTYAVDVRDSVGDPGEARDQAADLAGDVSLLAGGASSASALAIADDVANQQGIPYMAGPAEATELTGGSDTCSSAVFRASETSAMEARTGAKHLANGRADISSVFIYYADYSYGESVRDNYQRVLENNGVRVAGTQALPVGYDDDWPGRFEAAADAGVDAAIGGFTISTLPAMVGTYLTTDYDFRLVTGLGSRLSCSALGATLRASLDEFTAEAIERSGVGPFTSRYHWNQYDNSIARDANAVHRGAYGTNADVFTSGMFTGASAIVQAVEQGGSSDPVDLVSELTGMTVEETMKGVGGYQFQEYNNQARSPMTVVDLVPNGDDRYWDAPARPSRPVDAVGADETTRPRAITDCRLD